jgi:patatin-like phospholipase/acyl hydrolase
MADRVRVLSIDGGGIRGMIPALVLAEIERRAERPTAELFDLIAGTSAGGILACALTKPAEEGSAPAWRAAQLVELHETEGPRIFSRSVFQRIRSAEGLLDEKYPSAGLDSALERYLGDTPLRDALTDVLITAYETERRSPFFFKSRRARESAEDDFPMRLVARATAAAPTYFEPLRLEAAAQPDYFSLIDGGVFATNPAMCALAEVLRDAPGAEVLLLSLGTGQLTRALRYDEVRDWGLLEWARPLIDVVFDGVSDTVDYQVRQVLGPDRYWRLQTELTNASDDLDDASEENLRALRLQGEQLVRDGEREIEAAIAALTA